MHYTPPTTEDLQAFKEDLGLTGQQMAELAGVAGGQQWRKYTGGENPRAMSMHMLFFMAARLSLTDAELNRVREKMQSIGAEIEGLTNPIEV